MNFWLSLLKLLYIIPTPGSGAVQLRRGENLLDTRLFQRRTCREVVREPLLPGGGHRRFSYPVLGRLRTTLLELILPGQCRSRCR